MSQEKQVFSIDLAGRQLTVETGQLAKQANGAVLVRYGDTAVLSTATASKEAKNVDFFPLTVNYEERLYAVGKIPGGFIKREGRPSEKAILASRLIDRPIRPLFADGFRNEVQVVSIVMSVDQDCSSEMAAMLGSSLALSISDIPFEGPIAGATVGRINGEFVINPTVEQQEQSDIHLVVAGTKDAINMVEAGADQVPEETMLEAIMFGHDEIKRLIAFQEEIVQAVGKEKSEVKLYEVDADLNQAVREMAEKDMHSAIQVHEKHAREDAINEVKKRVIEHYEAQEADADTLGQVNEILYKIVKEEVRRLITVEKIRPDGRKGDEIRPLASEVGILSRTHGSGLFTRGQTQALSICTLGALGDVQILDGLGVEESKRFMHHYNFPSFSVGETRPMRGPGRREILEEALQQAKVGRVHILNHMLSVIAEPRTELSAYAPKIITMTINPDKIRDVIGPSGKQINKIIEETGVKIDIEQDGTVFISSINQEMNDKAKKIIEDIVREVQVGEIYEGKVKRVEKFGAFVELFSGKDGLVHISELALERVGKVEDVVKIGDVITVKVIEIDKQGRVNLSRKVLLKEEQEKEAAKEENKQEQQ